MCNFFSGIITKTGEVFVSKMSMRHEDIKKEYGFKDTQIAFQRENFLPFEILPPKDKDGLPDYFEKDFKKWKFSFDDGSAPSWWNSDMQKKCFDKLELTYSQYVLVGQKIDILNQYAILKDCEINNVNGGTINHFNGGTINNVNGGTINNVRDGTINNVRDGTINVWNENFKISLMEKSSAIVILRYKTPLEIVTEKYFKVELKKLKEIECPTK
jgi:hypothetical protein